MKRLLYLDNLKVCLTVLVIFHHAGQAYGDGGGWAYTPSNPAEVMPWIWHFFSVNAAFFMGLFFLISGYFVPASYDKQGASVFVQKKLMIALQNAVDGIWMGTFGKFMFIGVAITIASFGLTWLLRMIPGVKKVL